MGQVHTRLSRITLLFAIFVFAFAGTTASADSNESLSAIHPVSVVDADIYVNRTKTIMRLKPFAEDLELLQGCSPLDDGYYENQELRDATQDHAEFLAERIQLIDQNGNQLIPRIIEIIDIEFPEPEGDEEEGRIRSGELMKYFFVVTLEFVYDEQPEFLTINQEMVAEGQLLPSELKILLKQAGSDTPYIHMMKPQEPKTFQFDWDRPVLDDEASAEEWENWFEEQREKNLGIMSYSSIYSFLYIERFTVRHEILVPLATLTTIMDLEAEIEDSWLDIDEQDLIAQDVADVFINSNPIVIDGIEVIPTVDRVDFYGLDLKDFAMQAERRKISVANGRVGIILSYSTKGPPTNVLVTWELFNSVVTSVDSVIFKPARDENDAQVVKQRYSKFKGNTYEWTAPEAEALPPITAVSTTMDAEVLRPPVPRINLPVVTITLFCVGCLMLVGKMFFGYRLSTAWIMCGVAWVAGLFAWPLMPIEVDNPFEDRQQFVMPDEDAEEVFGQLHKNMFRAFDYYDESDIYDALANSVDGELLRELYLEINESLKVKEQGGARSRVDDVQLVEGTKVERQSDSDGEVADPEREPGFAYRCTWNLIGTIEHWGHIHERTNQYDAIFEVELVNDSWKIVSMEVVDESQGPVKTSLRNF
ncbi:MAG: hypothetical protein AAF456_11050 [Planctomycetota bacterium]